MATKPKTTKPAAKSKAVKPAAAPKTKATKAASKADEPAKPKRTVSEQAKRRVVITAREMNQRSRSSVSNITSDTTDEELAEPHHGQPSKFKPEMIEQVRKLCNLGATDAEVAQFFGITRASLRYWCMKNTNFAAAMRAGKERSDDRVERSLFARAVGFEHPAVKVFYNHKEGVVVEHAYTEIYPPDVEACKFWLMNRRSDLWRIHREADQVDPTVAAEVAQMAVAKAMATTIRQAEGLPAGAKVTADGPTGGSA